MFHVYIFIKGIFHFYSDFTGDTGLDEPKTRDSRCTNVFFEEEGGREMKR